MKTTTPLLMPKKLAQILIEDIDFSYFKNRYQKHDIEDYLYQAEDKINNRFSLSWSLGGTIGNCWNNKKHFIDPESEPYNHELYNFIEKNYPELSIKEIDIIQSYAIEDITYKSDYYGGRTQTQFKNLNFERLTEALCLLIYIEETDIIDFYEIVREHSQIVINIDEEDYYKLDLYKNMKEKLSDSFDVKKLKINFKL